MKGDKERVLECTTSAFDGLIAMVNPQDSWVVGGNYTGKEGLHEADCVHHYPQARYQRIGEHGSLLCKCGCSPS